MICLTFKEAEEAKYRCPRCGEPLEVSRNYYYCLRCAEELRNVK